MNTIRNSLMLMFALVLLLTTPLQASLAVGQNPAHVMEPIGTGDNSLLKEIENMKEVSELKNEYKIDFFSASKNSFGDKNQYAILIPMYNKVKETDTHNEEYLLFYVTNGELGNSFILTIASDEYDENTGYISFSDIERKSNITGVFKDGDFVKTLVNGEELNENTNKEIVMGNETLIECLERLFHTLPNWAKIACGSACAAFWTPIGATICAGCLVGLGISC
ncbi:hypothetical protein [Caldalkalibacillus mannanilyticus]|uniref:hypothetical protein n=1 Tax=Caldalkalibacillus mannanilyticus TaxID=1418 RepID=UPI00046A90AA|nr:hypothetical protein [Caldalkalibacillus mannanilyticus]